jgi:endonuclease III
MKRTTTAVRRIPEIIQRLKKEYPDAKCSLNYSNPLELLVATILSAQCTDERVNAVTRTLFQIQTPKDYVRVAAEVAIRCADDWLFRNKTKSIQDLERFWTISVERFRQPWTNYDTSRSRPQDLNVVIECIRNCFDVVVDTHARSAIAWD